VRPQKQKDRGGSDGQDLHSSSMSHRGWTGRPTDSTCNAITNDRAAVIATMAL